MKILIILVFFSFIIVQCTTEATTVFSCTCTTFEYTASIFFNGLYSEKDCVEDEEDQFFGHVSNLHA